ncbi:fumarylacetoacetate hydrolase family protein [Deltaproteobacteria bacterium IMCC39524]|nr:fumarylacetoacetate hydrolase family protein [Deltaproteobacteria bacterium IMCC39524]
MHTVKLDGRDIPVGKVVCIGRNYAEHIKELGNQTPDKPVIFIKPASAIVPSGGTIVIPNYSDDCHHEIELAVLIGKTAKDVTVEAALDYVNGYAVALDLTLRDVQGVQKTKGLPWEIAKAFDTSCPLSDFVPASQVDNPQELQLKLTVSGEVRQNGNTRDMMRSIAELIAAASSYFTLEEGDILLTGTPSGVGRIASGDQLEASIEQVGKLNVAVA